MKEKWSRGNAETPKPTKNMLKFQKKFILFPRISKIDSDSKIDSGIRITRFFQSQNPGISWKKAIRNQNYFDSRNNDSDSRIVDSKKWSPLEGGEGLRYSLS